MLRKGGMAIIVKCPTQPLNVGVIVTLVEREPDGAWLCEGNVKPAPGGRPYGREIPFKLTRVHPQFLRPIDDPGEDAKDETLSWLPAPNTTKETA